jgi:hypothetical protein
VAGDGPPVATVVVPTKPTGIVKQIRFEVNDSSGRRLDSSASSVCSRCGKIVVWRVRVRVCRWCWRVSGGGSSRELKMRRVEE